MIYTKTLTATSFHEKAKFTPKSVSRVKRNGVQCLHHKNEQTIVVWTSVQ